MRPAADAKGIALELRYRSVCGHGDADTTRLQQVFWNLLTNAVKFTPGGGRDPASLRRRTAPCGDRVTDSGVGISPEFLPFVFEPFRQADAAFDRGHGGLGLGLAITQAARGPARRHDRRRERRRGPRRHLHHPPAAGVVRRARAGRDWSAPASEAGTAVDSGAPSLHGLRDSARGRRARHADDVPGRRGSGRRAGAGGRERRRCPAGHRIVASRSPGERPRSPGMDGYELLRALRQRGQHAAFPAVAVSAYASADDRRRAGGGVQAHFAKPIDPRGARAGPGGGALGVRVGNDALRLAAHAGLRHDLDEPHRRRGRTSLLVDVVGDRQRIHIAAAGRPQHQTIRVFPSDTSTAKGAGEALP